MNVEEYIRENIRYELSTGKLFWIKKRNQSECGNYHEGYRRVQINKINFASHRIAWFLHYGSWPEKQLDHINGDKADNRINNLREVTNRENAINRVAHREGDKLPGTRKLFNGTYAANVFFKIRQYHLGVFKTEIEAHKAYVAAVKEIENNTFVPKYKPRIKKTQELDLSEKEK